MTLTQESQLIVIQPQQRLDSKHSNTLTEQLSSLVAHPKHLWVIDLVKVDFMDSSGLAALLKGISAIRSSGCRLVICNLQAPVRMIFELTQMDSVFEIYENYDAVVTMFNAQL
ncbi:MULTISPECIES: STAS domain-containing protein [unclassified Nostoc]|uniref:STAS domain-containing protein n=1 Tax=unclassified Nostoc TaxID=2593658 RepID=UPI002AD40938|nr:MULTISPECIES: STAS domain-containing protein [unclassified Nostoc]MDZ8121415.1 STAS domain-containing protein [Nostoc sp. CmiVER01]MDZ8224917.1 STAS domain-containing protein [Nostoc sp. ChiVER01]